MKNQRVKRYEILIMSNLQSGTEKVVYVTDADAAALEAEIERLREIATVPLLTPETTDSALFLRVLKEYEKGRPVNTQDLINALAWRVNNQRREIKRLQMTFRN